MKCPTPRTSHVRMSLITRRGFQVISLCESTGWEAIVRGARSFLRAGGPCRLFVTSALVMLLSAAVNLLLNHIIATRDVAIKDQSAADTAAAVAAAAAAAAAAAEKDAMAEAAAEARKAGLETSMDAPESRSVNSLPPQAAHAPGPLDTFGLTVSDNRVEFQPDVPFSRSCTRRVLLCAPWGRSTCSCPSFHTFARIASFTGSARSMFSRCVVHLPHLDAANNRSQIPNATAAQRSCAQKPTRRPRGHTVCRLHACPCFHVHGIFG